MNELTHSILYIFPKDMLKITFSFKVCLSVPKDKLSRSHTEQTLVQQPAMIPYSMDWIFLASSSYPFSPCHDLFYGCSPMMAACCH